MKKSIVLLSLMGCFVNYFGQETKVEPTKFKHEINFVLEDFLSKNSIYYDNVYNYNNVYYGNNSLYNANLVKAGFGYRLHFGKYALRARILLGTDNSTIEMPDYGTNTFNYLDLNANLGIERHLDIGKAQFFYGLDFGIKSGKNDYSFTAKDQLTYQNYKTENSSSSFVIAPLAGFKYQIHPAFSISTEFRFSLEKYENEFKTKYENQPNVEEIQKVEGFKTKIGPVGFLSFNFHF